MDYLFQDGGEPRKTNSKTKTSTKTGTKTKTTKSKSSSKKGGNFIGTVGDLVAPTGWGPFATAAGLLALDRADAALRRGKSTKSSAKKGGSGGITIKTPINNPTPDRKGNPYKVLHNLQIEENAKRNEGNNKLGHLQTSHSNLYSSQILLDNNEKKRWRGRHTGFMDRFYNTKAAQARILNKAYYQKFSVDDYINYYNEYVLSYPNFNNSLNKKNLLGEYLKALNHFFLSRITNIEVLKKELKKLKKSVDFHKLSGNPDLTKLEYIGKYFKDPFEWVTLGVDGNPVITQKLHLNLNN